MRDNLEYIVKKVEVHYTSKKPTIETWKFMPNEDIEKQKQEYIEWVNDQFKDFRAYRKIVDVKILD